MTPDFCWRGIFKGACASCFCPGGQFQAVGDERCTHLVVEENSIKELPFTPSKRLHVVKQEVWTWLKISQDDTQKHTLGFVWILNNSV